MGKLEDQKGGRSKKRIVQQIWIQGNRKRGNRKLGAMNTWGPFGGEAFIQYCTLYSTHSKLKLYEQHSACILIMKMS
jgi:hypothetical protein